MPEENRPSARLEIQVESSDYAPTDADWQGECRELYNRLLDLPEIGGITPTTQPAQAGEKGIMEQFHQFTAYGISTGAFSALYQVVKLWLEQRPRCDVILKFPDGSEIKVQKVSLQEANV